MKSLQFGASVAIIAWLCPLSSYSSITLPTVTSEPTIVDGPEGSRCIEMAVADVQWDFVWINYEFPGISLTGKSQIVLAFDIYRTYAEGYAQLLNWSIENGIKPEAGAQDPNGGADARTYPLSYWDEPYSEQFTPTVFDRFTTLEVIWDLDTETVSTVYDGGYVHLNYPIKEIGDEIYHFGMALNHQGEVGTGGEVAYLDNLLISIDGEDIFFDFEDFDLGALNGQQDWWSGASLAVIPEPAGLPLLLGALCGVTLFMRRLKRI